ncbi:MAG TPA: AMP-binding protein [Opitutaceae bacterium]|nr:AMP-binding protein [Opitutaceae bacterium]
MSAPLASDHQPISAAGQSLALIDGPALSNPPAPDTLLVDLLVRAAQNGSRGLIHLSADGTEKRQSYRALLSEAEVIATRLRDMGVKEGDLVIFQLERSAEYFSALWACFVGGFVAVPTSLPPSYDHQHAAVTKLQNAWDVLGRPMILTSADRVEGLRALGRQNKFADWTIQSVEALRNGNPGAARQNRDPRATAVLLLTSGSTGMPKAVALSDANLVQHAAGNAQANEFTADDISFNWMPLDHVGALVMFHLRDVFIAADQVHVTPESILQNPRNWLEWMHRYRATSTWAPNFAFALINDLADTFAGETWDLSCLRQAINGGEAVVSRTARRFLQLMAAFKLPETAMRPAWGMSETSSGTTYFTRFRLDTVSDSDTFVSVGGPIPGLSIRIVDPSGEIVAEGVTGSLQVRGAVVTSGYFKNPKANADAFTADGWFKTGDLGIVRDGELTIVGREKDVIIINGVNFHSHEIEAVAEQVNGLEISFTAASAVRRPGNDTDELAVFFSPAENAGISPRDLCQEIRAAVLREQGVSIDHLIALPKEKIPKTAIGKIQRAQLRKQFEAGVFENELAATTLPSWFFRRDWRAKPVEKDETLEAGETLWVIFRDSSALSEQIVSRIAERRAPIVTVDAGPSFEPIAPRAFVINPALAGDYDKLLETLNGTKARCVFVHLWSHVENAPGAEEETESDGKMRSGANSLLHFAGAFSRWATSDTDSRLLVVSSFSQSVQSSEAVYPSLGIVLGLTATLPHELPGLKVSHVDIPAVARPEIVTALIAEATAKETAMEVALRPSGRWVAGLAAVAEQAESAKRSKFKSGGLYVITGGLGGIGAVLSEKLLREFGAGLVITGRVSEDELRPERAQILQRLREIGSVNYERLDLADSSAWPRLWQSTQECFGRFPDGVIHLAGEYHERALAEETPGGLAGALEAKARGAAVLSQFLRDKPETLMVLFSSLLGYFGGFNTGAYAAANHYLENLARERSRTGAANTHCILWSSWSDLGMSHGLKDNVALRAKGFQEISPAQGWESLKFALSSSDPVILVGLDAANRQLAPFLGLTAESASAKAGKTFVAPRDAVESKLVEIWSQLLKVPQIGVQDSFFELGGRSLLAARLFARINQEFGKSLPLATLFTFSTIEQLATLIKGKTRAPLLNVSSSRIIPLQAKGSRRPLFGIPGRESNNLMYRDLVRPLGKDQPVYSLKVDVPGEAAVPVRAIESTAIELVKQIRSTQSRGPYRISGHGFGCIIAWEIARLLKTELETIFLIDPPPAEFFQFNQADGTLRFLPREVRCPRFYERLLRRVKTTLPKALIAAGCRYGDATLAATSAPVHVFGAAENAEPWRGLSPSGFVCYPAERIKTELPRILS